MPRLFFLLALGLTLSAPALAAAQDRADELITEGLALRGQGDDRGALPLLEEAHALRPTPRSAAQVGLVQQALGDWVGAATHLSDALASEDDRWIRRNRDALREAMEFVDSRVGRIELDVSESGAEVRIDGELRGSSPLPAVYASAGTIEVVVSKEGYRTVTRQVVITAGSLSRELVQMREGMSTDPTSDADPVTNDPPDDDPIADPGPRDDAGEGGGSGRIFTWIAAGVAVAAGVGAGLTWWQANEQYAGLEIGGDGEACMPNCQPEHTSSVSTLVTVTNVLLVTSIVAGAGAILLFFVEGSGDDGDESLSVGIGPGSVTLRGRF